MSFFAADNLRALTAGRWLRRPAAGTVASGVGTDTREDLTDRVFVALRGEQFDGHAYVGAAAERGAVLALVERETREAVEADLGVLLVPDTRTALARLALAYRRTLVGTRVIAITGTCGKTTTKSLVHAVLSPTLAGSAARRSFNNEIGVPLTVLAARPHDKYLVVEIGTSAPGEITRLARIVEPDIAIITMVGRGHLEGFGSVEAVVEEKAALMSHLRRSGVAIINGDDPALDRFARGVTVLRFGRAERADFRLTACARGTDGRWWFEVNGRTRFDLGLPGRHNAMNALAAVAVGRRMGLDDPAMSAALAQVVPAPMRMERIELPWGDGAGVTVHNDAYNANPESMTAALEAFAEEEAGAPRRIVVLGDMLELGPGAASMHEEIGKLVIDLDTRRGIDHAFLVGPLAAAAAAVLRRVWPDHRVTALDAPGTEAACAIAAHLRPGDAVLVKASRGLRLERMIETWAHTAPPVAPGPAEGWAPEITIADDAPERTPSG